MPTLCLNMIVKNEAKIIVRALNSVVKYIDYWVICDTGSTDGTQDIITNFFKERNVDGKLCNHKWQNFGYNRTLALSEASSKADYILLMDADMEMIVYNPFFKELLKYDIYNVLQGIDFVYYNTRIIKGNLDAKYVGVTHEFIKIESTDAAHILNDIKFVEYCDGGNRPEKYTRDVQLLTEGVQIETDNIIKSRYMFYLGQSHFDLKNYESAIVWYEKRVECGGWHEEIFYSLCKIGLCKKNLIKSKYEIVNAFMAAYNFHKKRYESIYELMLYLREQCLLNESLTYMTIALSVVYPSDDVLFVHKDIYDYKLYDEIALCAYYNNNFILSYALWKRISNEKKYPNYEETRISKNLNFSKEKLYEIKTKKILCFYIGYTKDITNVDNLYGSEIALLNLADQLKKFYNVYIFGYSVKHNVINEINYRNSNELNEFMCNNLVDIMIISRYIHYFIEFENKANKTFIWIHDMCIAQHWNNIVFPNDAKCLVKNIDHQINGYIVLSEWHKNYILNLYHIDEKKIHIIGNAINLHDFDISAKKHKNRFIWTSAPNRGLDKMIECIHEIKKIFTDVELFIYRGSDEMSDILKNIEGCDYIHYCGKVDNKTIIQKFMESDIWFYPTNWMETYCISALEAQMAGCVCIASDLAGLATTVSNRGLLYKNINKENIIEIMSTILPNDDVKDDYRTNGINWAKLQTWDARVLEWIELF